MERFKRFLLKLGYIWLWLYSGGALVAGLLGVTDHFSWTPLLVFLSGVFGATVVIAIDVSE